VFSSCSEVGGAKGKSGGIIILLFHFFLKFKLRLTKNDMMESKESFPYASQESYQPPITQHGMGMPYGMYHYAGNYPPLAMQMPFQPEANANNKPLLRRGKWTVSKISPPDIISGVFS
jgi:hypothetical protein